jgi:hypothetical protein
LDDALTILVEHCGDLIRRNLLRVIEPVFKKHGSDQSAETKPADPRSTGMGHMRGFG